MFERQLLTLSVAKHKIETPDDNEARAKGPQDDEPCGPIDREPQTDAALTALLRCLIYELGVDLAMISLLDEKYQYFLAGASSDSLSSAKVTLDSSQWFSCDVVAHPGGLCERTVTMNGLPAIYKELDLSAKDRTSRLPFVDGTIASFRHYAGTPLVAPNGMAIGTVFTLSNQPSAGLQQRQRQFLTDTSEHVMRQLVQAVRALEGSRAVMFNTAVASLLSASASFIHAFDEDPHAANLDSERNNGEHAPFVLNIYEHAAELLLSAFELDAAQIHNIALASHSSP